MLVLRFGLRCSSGNCFRSGVRDSDFPGGGANARSVVGLYRTSSTGRETAAAAAAAAEMDVAKYRCDTSVAGRDDCELFRCRERPDDAGIQTNARVIMLPLRHRVLCRHRQSTAALVRIGSRTSTTRAPRTILACRFSSSISSRIIALLRELE